MFVLARSSENAKSDVKFNRSTRHQRTSTLRPRMGRRVHVIFVINVISSALILLISCGIVGVTTAQQVLSSPPAVSREQQQQQPTPAKQSSASRLTTVPLGSLQPEQEAYVFTSSFDTERDRIDQLVRQWAPLVWLAPGEKYMPSSVTDFLHHVHAEKLKNSVKNKNKYPTNNGSGDQEEDNNEDDDDMGDRDNEHELYLLHQHQQQLSEKITEQLLRQQQHQQQHQDRLSSSANRRNSDAQAAESASSGANLNPWERRNKRTYHDENLLMDYIIDMPVGENSENWNLVTNDDLDALLDKPTSFIYGQSPATGPVPIYAMISSCSGGGDPQNRRPPAPPLPFQPHPLPGVDQSSNEINNPHIEYKHNPYIPTNMNYFTSQDALPLKYTGDVSADQYGIGEKVASLNPVRGNDLELGQRRKREAVQVVMAESVQSYDGNLNVNDLYNKNFTERQPETENRTEESSTASLATSSASNTETGSAEWSVLVENNSNLENVDNQNWTPQNYHRVPPPQHPVPTPPRTVLYPKQKPNFGFQSIKRKIESHKRKVEQTKDSYPHFHVTYWLFYPYSQGKTMCSISLGPLGRLPIPLIFGMCLGTRKDFGSHVGDWEHMSLWFRGRPEPDEMYVSAHDAGAFYEYDRLTGTFEFRDQETRVGILQKPVFPRSVLTSNKHPVLFAARGSHGLWTAPGKHRFVRVPRLYDINGFGVPWATWKNTEIIYTDDIQSRSFKQHWIQFQGRWGNGKSKCHPLKRIGLHFCEFSDGPKGITNRRPHFQCERTAPETDFSNALPHEIGRSVQA